MRATDVPPAANPAEPSRATATAVDGPGSFTRATMSFVETSSSAASSAPRGEQRHARMRRGGQRERRDGGEQEHQADQAHPFLILRRG